MRDRAVPALVGRLKASPYADAIHSLCLSNEPVNTGCSPNNPYSVAQFSKYMETKYGPVTAFNTATGRKFAGYGEVAKAVMSDIAARYAFYSFSRESFADWHRMLAEEIKKVWPEIPVHSKIMVFSSPFEYVAGIDPELMSEFSDYNGNDNYFYRRGPFIADWNVTAMTHEMQISAKPASVANTENHIIPDRETRPVSNDHIYSALFQQFVTGASTLTTWVWADVDYAAMLRNPKGDFVGNIRLRPGNIVAHAMAGIDGLRLAPQLRKFFDYKPEVAILYSPTSLICSPDVYRAQADALYTQLCFTGYRVRFLSERQLARGEFGNVKLLYVVGAKHISDEGLKGLERFVNAGGKPLPLVLKGLLGGEQQHGDWVPSLPQGLHQGVPIHPGHHHVGDDQVHRPALQHLQRLHAVPGAHHVEPVLQFGGGEQAHGVVVLHQQNGRHAAPPLPPGRYPPPKKSFWTFPTAGVILY